MKIRLMLGKLKGAKEVETQEIYTIVDSVVDNSELKLLDGTSDRIEFRSKT